MKISIIGTRGVPANYGGFETFAEEISKNIKILDPNIEITVVCDFAQKEINNSIKELDNINTSGIAQDIEENGIKKILWREFANYECQIVGSPEDAINALKDYHFKDDIIYTEWSSYWNWCIDNDQF